MNLLNIVVIALFGYLVGSVTSQSLLDFSSFVVVCACFFQIFNKQSKTPFSIKLIGIDWAFLGYFIAIIVSYMVNQPPFNEVLFGLRKTLWIPLIYVLIRSFQEFKFESKFFIKVTSLLFLVPNLYAIVTYLYQYDFLQAQSITRAVGMVNSATYHAHGNAIIFVFFVGLIAKEFTELSKKWKILVSISTLLFGLSILLTFTRGIWISTAISLLFIALFRFKVKEVILISFLTISIAVGAYLSWPAFQERIKNTAIISTNQERIDFFKVNVQIWKEHLIFGIGYGENIRRNREYWDRPEWNKPRGFNTSHAHNQYLNVLSTTGIFGFIFFISFILYFVKKNYDLIRLNNSNHSLKFLGLVIMATQIEILMAYLSDVTFEYAKIRALIILLWAFLIHLLNLSKSNSIKSNA